MIDYVALTIAKHMPAHPAPGVKMSGGDSPLWNADMDYWIWSERRVYNNPRYIYKDSDCDSFEVSGVIES